MRYSSLTPETRIRIRFTATVIGVCLVGSVLFGWIREGTALNLSVTAYSVAVCLLIAAPLTAFEVYSEREDALNARWPAGVVVAVKTALYSAVIVGALLLVRWLFGETERGGALWNRGMTISAIFAVTLAALANFGAMVARLLGPEALLHFFTGRYHRPREEERLLMFLDLAGSTELAERLGGLRFHRFLDLFFRDVAHAVAASGGSIHKYVGDQVIVSWAPGRDARALACPFLLARRLDRRAERYRSEFEGVPRFRCGFHRGVIVAGEIGSLKQEIAFLGDAMNTAARVEETCRDLGHTVLATRASLRDGMDLADLAVTPLGPVALRGKAEPVELVALTPA